VNVSTSSLSRPGLAWLAGGLTVGLLAASLMGSSLGIARAQSPSPDPAWPVLQRTDSINVSGVGRVSISPDVADVRLGVTFRADTSKEAADLAANAMDAVIAALIEWGIAEADIQTTQLALNPVYDWDDDPPQIEGWEAVNIVSVTVRDVTTVGDLVDAATSAGATNVEGITFRLDDPAEAEAEARSAAVADAKARADQLASEAGVDIGGVISITEISFGPPQPFFMDGGQYAAGAAMEDMAATPVLAGEVEVSVTVMIEYEIE
jgi:uncharacterized protein